MTEVYKDFLNYKYPNQYLYIIVNSQFTNIVDNRIRISFSNKNENIEADFYLGEFHEYLKIRKLNKLWNEIYKKNN